MRPLKLTMQAFNSYGKKTMIDFTKPNQNLFLITGDTGTGKTTIFDAIVFAIYGEASSSKNKKDGIELQSQYVNFEIEPFVELTFSEKNGEKTDIYTVRRIPRHIRPLKRGSGFKENSESVSLIMPDETEYPQKEANHKLEEIVGLTKGQFMQVAMIAQGEFVELLQAKSDDKKVIFRKLFNTQLFQNIVDELGKRRKEKQSEIAQICIACQTEVGHVVIPEDYEEADKVKALTKRILYSDKLSVTDMEKLMEELKSLCEKLSEGKKRAQKDYDKASKDRDTKRDSYANAQNLLKFFEQLEKAKKDLAECEKAEAEIEKASRLIIKINAAYEIKAVYQRYDDAVGTVKDIEKNLKENQDALPGLTTAYETATNKEKEAKDQQNLKLEAFTKVSERVAKALEILHKINKAKEDFTAKENINESAEKAAKATEKELTDFETQECEWRRQAEELGDADKLLALWNVKSEKAGGMTDDLESAKKAKCNVNTQRKKAEKAHRDYMIARGLFTKRNEEFSAKQKAFLDAQAGFIAKENLKSGYPCPVCGSIDHPNPCELSEEHQNLTREIIQSLQDEVANLQHDMSEKSKTAGSSSGLLVERENNMNDTLDKLRQRMAKSITIVQEQITLEQAEELLDDWKQVIEAEGIVLKKNAETLASVQDSLKGIDGKKKALKDAAEKAMADAVTAKTDLVSSRTALDGLESSKDYPTEEDANTALTSAKRIKAEMDAVYNTAYIAAQKAKTVKENAETLIAKYKKDLPCQTKERDQRKNSYEKIMAEKDLAEYEWKEIIRKHSKSDTTAFQTKVDAHNIKKTSAESLLTSTKQAIGEQKKPVLEDLKADKEEAEQKLTVAQVTLEQYKENYKADSDAYDALAPKMESRSKIMEEHKRLDDLYNLLAGKVTGARMDIETFVQRYYLENILYAANNRFQDMSAGQFELRMYDIDKAGEGKNHGLDLMVYSTVTCKEREVRTLSGGESFMAALSLALGMADQIQESSAAINLDVMFIDEGFGSLDDHSRGQAVKVLQRMASGSKLIGIISHVTELKQEIEDQLIVSKNDTGSHVRWQIS